MNGEYRDWAGLPQEITASILLRLSVFERLLKAEKVCRSWRRVCKDPLMWRKLKINYDNEILNRELVDRSRGELLEIDIWCYGSDSLLIYIAERSSNLRSLGIHRCREITRAGISTLVLKLPLLEEVKLSYFKIGKECLKVIGQSCPNLKVLEIRHWGNDGPKCDDEAQAIAETMPGLRHLHLLGNHLSNTGLKAILDNCPHLEHLELRFCFFIDKVDLEYQCIRRIKYVRLS